MVNPSPLAPSRKRTRKRLLLGVCLLAITAPAIFLARPGWHLWQTARSDIDYLEPIAPGFTDDASRMNLTAIRDLRVAPAVPAKAERELASLLAEADTYGWKVSIAGAQHTMGGHTIYPGGVVIDMRPLADISLDEKTNVLHVGAGALWRDVIARLDGLGRSVSVMQSNNSFTVGGSISANCHGWQVGRPPVASTVRGFRLMLADGKIVYCSRDENAELFSCVLGGYGLFGIILDVDLATVPNRLYRLDRRVVPAAELPATWSAGIAEHSDSAEMVYGRLNVMSDRFLEDAIVYVLYVDPNQNHPIPPIQQPASIRLQREILRGAAIDEYGKRLRWQAELKWQPMIGGEVFSRNQLLNEGVEIFQNRSSDTTDILHEYFVPRAAFERFVARVRAIVPKHSGNLLNITVRSVETDGDTQLRYATEPVFSLVMLFQQRRTAAADEQMGAMTRDLIDAALDLGGRYYLPYRLHATCEQFHRAYRQADAFFALKRKYDPNEIFQNQFYLKYGAAAGKPGPAD
jgi:FAD/FMN-containing dehydrogenase